MWENIRCMAITNDLSFLPVLDQFTMSWEMAEAAAGGAILVEGGVDAVGALGLRTEMAGRLEGVRALEMEERFHREVLRMRRAELRGRLEDFYAVVRVWWGEAAVREGLAGLPREDGPLEGLLRAARDAVRVWGMLDAGAAPAGVVLPLGLTGAGGVADFFQADLAGLVSGCESARDGMEAAEVGLRVARAERDRLQMRVRAVLLAYGRAAEARLGARHPVVVAVPRLYAATAGREGPLEFTARWDAGRQVAVLVWEGAAAPAGSAYRVLWCRGQRYDARVARVAGEFPIPVAGPVAVAGAADPVPEVPATGAAAAVTAGPGPDGSWLWETDAGLTIPGTLVWYKVVLVRPDRKRSRPRSSVSVAVRRPR